MNLEQDERNKAIAQIIEDEKKNEMSEEISPSGSIAAFASKVAAIPAEVTDSNSAVQKTIEEEAI